MPTACAPMMSVSMRSPTKTGRPAPERRSASSMSGRNGLPTTSGSWSSVLRTAWIAAPANSLAWLWGGLLRASAMLRRALSFLEQRYYLAGLLIAVIIVIMLFIQ